MSGRAKEFLDQFVEGLAATGHDGEGAEYTLKEDANAEGISDKELVQAAGGDLGRYLKDALAGNDRS